MFITVLVTDNWLRGSTTLRREARRIEKSCVRELTVQYTEKYFQTVIRPVTPSESVRLCET